MPRVSIVITPDDSPSISDVTTRNPESIQLFMPSNIDEAERLIYCDPELVQMETDIRYSCAVDALQDLRRQLHFRVYINQLKIKNVTGQRPNTRARTMQKTIEGRVNEAAERYRRAQKAYVALAGATADRKLRELKPEHVVGLGEKVQQEIERREIEAIRARLQANAGDGEAEGPVVNVAETPQVTSGESRRKISWLWYSGGLEDGEEGAADDTEGTLTGDMNDGKLFHCPESEDGDLMAADTIGVRVEWLKARARAQRWEEEVRLLRVEMERVLQTFLFMAAWWEGQTPRTSVMGLPGEVGVTEVADENGAQIVRAHDSDSSPLKEGLLAYAAEQADMYRGLRDSFKLKWSNVHRAAGVFLARQSVLD